MARSAEARDGRKADAVSVGRQARNSARSGRRAGSPRAGPTVFLLAIALTLLGLEKIPLFVQGVEAAVVQDVNEHRRPNAL